MKLITVLLITASCATVTSHSRKGNIITTCYSDGTCSEQRLEGRFSDHNYERIGNTASVRLESKSEKKKHKSEKED